MLNRWLSSQNIVDQTNKNQLSQLAFIAFFLFSFLTSAGEGLAAEFRGVVHDPQGQPVSKATVRLQGTIVSTATDENGRFEIITDTAVSSKYITAWKNGFYNAGAPLLPENKEYRIVLKSIHQDDDRNYKWRSSLRAPSSTTTNGVTTEEKSCRDCHPVLTEQWQKDAHGGSATNPLFLAFFNGAGSQGRQGVGPGYKLDFPNSNGNCSTCHVPALALINAFNADPNKASGVEKEGVFCDLCHKIDNVRIDQTGGYPGILSIQFRRPPDGRQVFYGQYDDVFPGDDSYHPLYKESRYCAPCHHGKFWGVLMYSEFQEWVESDYPAKNIHCQDCHMPADKGMTHFALEKEGGVERKPGTIPSHLFTGVKDRAFMSEAIDLSVQADQKGDVVKVTVTVKNTKSGHHYPSGNPMRNMILLVDAIDEKGRKLPLLEGEKVPVWGGVGDVKEGNYAGLPGKGFAKVLRDAIAYPDQRGRHFQPEYPAPHWRPALIESDNRIPADGSDVSTYRYQIPADLTGSIDINAGLIFRRTYKKWLDIKGVENDEMEIARQGIKIMRR